MTEVISTLLMIMATVSMLFLRKKNSMSGRTYSDESKFNLDGDQLMFVKFMNEQYINTNPQNNLAHKIYGQYKIATKKKSK